VLALVHFGDTGLQPL